jgi:PAS domain S-box-containing protein
MHESPRTRLVAYGVAVLATGVSLLVRWPLWPVMGHGGRYMTFFPAVMVSAYYGGFGPGLLATFLSALAATYFLTEPCYAFEIASVHDAVGLVLFVLVGTIISGLNESLHRMRRRIAAEERQRAAEAVYETEERFRKLAEKLHEIFWMMDACDDRTIYVSPAYQEIWGRTCQSVQEQPCFWMESVHPDDRDVALAQREQQRRGVFTDGEFRVVRPDGSVRWIRNRAFPLKNRAGKICRIGGLMEDITERKRAEEALRESEHRWRSLTEALPQLVWSAAPDGACDYFSTQWTAFTGVPEEELLGWRWLAVLHPDDRQPTRQFWTAAVDGRSAYDVEYRVRRSDGTYRWFKTRGVPIRDSEGWIVKWFGTCTDITDHKEAAAALQVANARLDLAVRGSHVGIWEIDMPDGIYEHGRAHFVNVWDQVGYDCPDAPGDFAAWMALVHPDDRERLERSIEARLSGETREFGNEYRVRHRDGSYRWVLSRGVVVRDAEGKPIRFAGSCFDITDLKRAEEALRASEQRFRLLTEQAPDAIFLADLDGRYTAVNTSACRMLGYEREELVGKQNTDLVPAEEVPLLVERREALLRGEAVPVAEYRLRRKDGVFLPVEFSSCLLPDGRWLGIGRDISERKRQEAELRRAKEAAEAANRAKSEFLANVSHEIRTPMNAILGMTELTLDTPLAEEQQKYLTTVKSSAEALLNVINDLLDFSKIEAGKLELDSADFSLRSLLNETLRALALRAHRKGLELVCQIRPGVPDALMGDAGRLRQVLLNLVGNAIKFTEEGEVVVRVSVSDDKVTEEPADSSVTLSPCHLVTLSFEVSDTGIGIPADKQHRIFQAFEQVDTSMTRRYEGTGLGLSIASRLVDLMGGRITVESEPDQGSTFRFTARFRQPSQPLRTSPVGPVVHLHGQRVLIVDDNATNRLILEEWLRDWRTEPTAVADGLTALDALWRAVALGQPYPLVLLDARMPGCDGLALAAKIAQSPELSRSRIILLSSEDHPGDLKRHRKLGIAAVATKPLQQEELLETIYRVLSRAPTAQPMAERPAADERDNREPANDAAPARPLRVLLAEDNDLNQQVVQHLLERKGHTVQIAGDGREALAALEQGGFDLLLLDVHMPELDGFQVIQALRQREQATGQHLPVIALTARSMKGDRERCLQAGMDDYLAKPLRARELFATMDRLLAASPAGGPTPGASAPLPAFLDAATLLAACGGDPSLLEKMSQALQANASAYLDKVHDAIQRGDAAALREAAHKLRGLVSAFSTQAAESARLLEQLAADEQLPEAEVQFTKLADLVATLIPMLANVSVEQLKRRVGQRNEAGSS